MFVINTKKTKTSPKHLRIKLHYLKPLNENGTTSTTKRAPRLIGSSTKNVCVCRKGRWARVRALSQFFGDLGLLRDDFGGTTTTSYYYQMVRDQIDHSWRLDAKTWTAAASPTVTTCSTLVARTLRSGLWWWRSAHCVTSVKHTDDRRRETLDLKVDLREKF